MLLVEHPSLTALVEKASALAHNWLDRTQSDAQLSAIGSSCSLS